MSFFYCFLLFLFFLGRGPDIYSRMVFPALPAEVVLLAVPANSIRNLVLSERSRTSWTETLRSIHLLKVRLFARKNRISTIRLVATDTVPVVGTALATEVTFAIHLSGTALTFACPHGLLRVDILPFHYIFFARLLRRLLRGLLLLLIFHLLLSFDLLVAGLAVLHLGKDQNILTHIALRPVR